LQGLLPVLFVAGLWIGLHPLLVNLGLTDRARSAVHLIEQGGLVGLCLFFTLKYLLPAFLLLYLVASYVYLGGNALWDFISTTARNLVTPLRRIPLRFAKLDFSPIVAVLLILLLLHWLPNFILGKLTERNLVLWPQ
jgi:uncharacterized protein YggT (Ycf19 family)